MRIVNSLEKSQDQSFLFLECHHCYVNTYTTRAHFRLHNPVRTLGERLRSSVVSVWT